MSLTYCGNNANFQGLFTGTHVLGTNYQCLKKGIGVGLHLPFDPSYTVPHIPIDDRRYYCGTSAIVPAGYDDVGSPSICHRTGVGIGKAERAKKGRGYSIFLSLIPYVIFCIISGVIFCVFYFGKFSFITQKDDTTGEVKIDWNKFIPYYIMTILLCFMLFLYFKHKLNFYTY